MADGNVQVVQEVQEVQEETAELESVTLARVHAMQQSIIRKREKRIKKIEAKAEELKNMVSAAFVLIFDANVEIYAELDKVKKNDNLMAALRTAVIKIHEKKDTLLQLYGTDDHWPTELTALETHLQSLEANYKYETGDMPRSKILKPSMQHIANSAITSMMNIRLNIFPVNNKIMRVRISFAGIPLLPYLVNSVFGYGLYFRAGCHSHQNYLFEATADTLMPHIESAAKKVKYFIRTKISKEQSDFEICLLRMVDEVLSKTSLAIKRITLDCANGVRDAVTVKAIDNEINARGAVYWRAIRSHANHLLKSLKTVC